MPRVPSPSPTRRVLGAVAALTAASALALAAPSTTWAAGTHRAVAADRASDAPVTQPDRVTIPADGVRLVDVLANDSDPDGDSLVACRTAVAPKGQPQAVPISGLGESTVQAAARASRAVPANPSLVISTEGVAPGTYTVGYDACDFTYVTPGTVTVTVTKSVNVTVKKVAGKTGTLRFHNPGPHAVHVTYIEVQSGHTDPSRPGRTGRDDRAHTFRLGAHATKTVHVTSTTVFYDATTGDGPAGAGIVQHIRQPRSHRHHGSGSRHGHVVRASDDGTDQAPVTVADRVHVVTDGFAEAPVLANDTDADSTDLQVCRITGPARLHASIETLPAKYVGGQGNALTSEILVPGFDVRPGTYQLTYYACDDQLLTPGTLTVTVTQSPDIEVRKHGHAYRFHNPGPRVYHVTYGDHPVEGGHHEKPLGRFVLKAGQSRTVHVSGSSMFYDARWGHGSEGGSFGGSGVSSSAGVVVHEGRRHA